MPTAVLPQLSTAVQVRIITEPAQPSCPPSVTSSNLISTEASQLSVAVTFSVPNELSLQLTSISAGIPDNTGGVLSCTVII